MERIENSNKDEHCTESNLLKLNGDEEHRAIHTKAKTTTAGIVVSALLEEDEAGADIVMLLSAL